jgi:hypothetical protein
MNDYIKLFVNTDFKDGCNIHAELEENILKRIKDFCAPKKGERV